MKLEKSMDDQLSPLAFLCPFGASFFWDDQMAQVDINLTARMEQVDEPWLWRLGQEFDVKVNILKANIDQDFGWVQVRLEGPIEEIQRATAWLMTTGLHVDALQRSMGA